MSASRHRRIHLGAAHTCLGHVLLEAVAQVRVRVLLAGLVAELARARHRALWLGVADLEAPEETRNAVVDRLAGLREDRADQVDTFPDAARAELARVGGWNTEFQRLHEGRSGGETYPQRRSQRRSQRRCGSGDGCTGASSGTFCTLGRGARSWSASCTSQGKRCWRCCCDDSKHRTDNQSIASSAYTGAAKAGTAAARKTMEMAEKRMVKKRKAKGRAKKRSGEGKSDKERIGTGPMSVRRRM
jgi:hypothetical protein